MGKFIDQENFCKKIDLTAQEIIGLIILKPLKPF